MLFWCQRHLLSVLQFTHNDWSPKMKRNVKLLLWKRIDYVVKKSFHSIVICKMLDSWEETACDSKIQRFVMKRSNDKHKLEIARLWRKRQGEFTTKQWPRKLQKSGGRKSQVCPSFEKSQVVLHFYICDNFLEFSKSKSPSAALPEPPEYISGPRYQGLGF